MFRSRLLRKWLPQAFKSTPISRASSKPRATRLRVEALEDRTLPAAPVVIQVDPPRNVHTASTSTNVSATFNQAIDSATVSAQNFAVHSGARGRLVGSRVSSVTASGATVTLDPAVTFFPGELVEFTTTSRLRNSAGEAAVPFVSRFQTSVRDGTGFFADSGQSLSGGEARRVRLGDLDGDGDLDAYVANAADQPDRVFFNDGRGNFSDSGQRLGSDDGHDVALGDVDGDGDLDAYVVTRGQGSRVFLNDGRGNFTDSGQRLGSGDGLGVALGDLDGDGDLDAFVANGRYQADRVWVNDGRGNFTDSGQSLGSEYGRWVALGDLDGDGDLDAFVANVAGQQSRVWLNDGAGRFSAGATARPSLDVALGDVDGDGDLDALLTAPGQTRVLFNDGRGNFAEGAAFDAGYRPALALGDLDGDGDLDLFAANASPSRVFLNDGRGNFADSGQGLPAASFPTAALGDLDGDGDLDAFLANASSQGNRVLLNTGFIPKAGGPYTVAEGASLSLDESGSFGLGSLLSFRWDVDGDGDFDENVTGRTPTVTWARLVQLGVNDGPATRMVTVEASFGTRARRDSAALTVVNAAPAALLTGPSTGVRGEAQTFTLSAVDASPIDQAANFTFTINWGDGSTQTLTGPSDTAVEHVFRRSGTYAVSLTARDKDGGVSAVTTRTVTVDPLAIGGGSLVIGGTDGDDVIDVTPGERSGAFVVTILSPTPGGPELTVAIVRPAVGGYEIDLTVGEVHFGATFFPFAPPPSELTVYAQGGDDVVTISGAVSLQTTLFGGDGSDVLQAGGGNSVLVGDAGNDTLVGGPGRDILIGGAGSDALFGEGGEDILIGGLFLAAEQSQEAQRAELRGVAAVWSSDSPLDDRVTELSAYLAPRVDDDGARDELTGGGGINWYFARTSGADDELDALIDVTPDDLVTPI